MWVLQVCSPARSCCVCCWLLTAADSSTRWEADILHSHPLQHPHSAPVVPPGGRTTTIRISQHQPKPICIIALALVAHIHIHIPSIHDTRSYLSRAQTHPHSDIHIHISIHHPSLAHLGNASLLAPITRPLPTPTPTPTPPTRRQLRVRPSRPGNSARLTYHAINWIQQQHTTSHPTTSHPHTYPSLLSFYLHHYPPPRSSVPNAIPTVSSACPD